MKKYHFYIAMIGLVLIFSACLLLFSNSNKKIDMSGPMNEINELSKEINELVVTDKIESTRKYEVKISEIKLAINLLDSTNFKMYKDYEISLFDYFINNNQIKEYNKLLDEIENNLENKLK